MRRTILALAGVVALCATSGAAAAPPHGTPNAAHACKAQRQAIGTDAFRQMYGTNHNRRNAFGRCVSTARRQARSARSAAAAACRSEQQADPTAFAQKYGTGGKGHDAFGRCVSGRAATMRQDQQAATLAVARRCRIEQRADPAGFTQKYGKNHNRRNAFGRCVSTLAKA